jgi:hypothetical protein
MPGLQHAGADAMTQWKIPVIFGRDYFILKLYLCAAKIPKLPAWHYRNRLKNREYGYSGIAG